METIINKENDPRKYVAYNPSRYPYNCMYSLNTQRFGLEHDGYVNVDENVLFQTSSL